MADNAGAWPMARQPQGTPYISWVGAKFSPEFQRQLEAYKQAGGSLTGEGGEVSIGENEYGPTKSVIDSLGRIITITRGPNNQGTRTIYYPNASVPPKTEQIDMTRRSVGESLGRAALFMAPAVAAPLVAGALGVGAAGAAGTAGTVAAAAPEIGAGLFAGGAETAALGAAPSLTGGALLGGEAAAAPLTMGAAGAGGFAAPVAAGGAALGGAGQMASSGSGLMSWLGAPAAQLAGQAINAGVQYSAAGRASEQQQQAAQAAMDEQRRQFDITRQSLAPFAQAGTQALGGFAPYQAAGLQAFGQQQALAGLQGQQAQRQAIGALEASPEYQALARQGEEAILQRASATGGLRGGNVQAALAQFRPAMLQQLIDQQYQRLGGFAGTGLQTTTNLAEMGRAAATQQGSFGSATAANIGNLLTQQGQAQAGGTLGMARGVSGLLSAPAQIYGFQRGLGQA